MHTACKHSYALLLKAAGAMLPRFAREEPSKSARLGVHPLACPAFLALCIQIKTVKTACL